MNENLEAEDLFGVPVCTLILTFDRSEWLKIVLPRVSPIRRPHE